MDAPFVNMNGNSQRQIEETLSEIYDGFEDLIDKIQRSEYAHGRNTRDNEHLKAMREQKMKVQATLRELRDGYLEMLHEVTKD